MKISVVIPVKNGADTLEACLDGIFSQKIGHPLEVLAVDSGSTDGSLEILRAHPVRVISIHPGDFNHGDTRNLGASETEGDLIVFTVQDALPADDRWLARLTENLIRDGDVAGAFSRIVPRSGCGPLVERGVKGDLNFGTERIEMTYDSFDAPDAWDPHTRRVRANFNDVSSCIRRSVWERIPYQRTPFGEDIIWSDSALRAGYKIVFDPESVVIHSHEYQPASVFPRTHIDGWFNRAYFDRKCIERFRHVLIMTWRQFREDRAFLKALGLGRARRLKESATSLAYHFMEFLGFYLGGKTAEKLFPVRPVAAGSLKVLMVLSLATQKDPESSGAVLALARALQDRGHRVVFAGPGAVEAGRAEPGRMEAAGLGAGNKGAGSTPMDWGGFPLHRLPGAPPEGDPGFSPPTRALTDALKRLLDGEEPDLVHCLDFEGFTRHVADLAGARPLPCIVTLSDFWFCCPRRNLARPDGSFCHPERPPGLGCAPCMGGQWEYIHAAILAGRAAVMMGKGMSRLGKVVAGGERRTGFLKRPSVMQASLSRADFVLAPSLLARSRCEGAGAAMPKVVHTGYGAVTAPLQVLAAALKEWDAGREELLEIRWDGEAAERMAGELVVKYRQALSCGTREEQMASAPAPHGC